jgi:hypothetical protein
MKLHRVQNFRRLVAVVGLACTAAGLAVVSPAISANSLSKPAWLADFSLGVKESYDDNIYLVGLGTLKNRSSWITTVTPKIGFNFTPLVGTNLFQTVGFNYSADVVTFHDAPTESYTAHRLGVTLAAKRGDVSFTAENNFIFVDGDDSGPIFPDGRSGIATAAVRERREQWQDRSKVTLQFDWGRWFVRPTAVLTYYDLMTSQHAGAGYDNYCDRYDLNGGADLGFRFNPHFAATLGYRYGHQYQQQYDFDPSHLSSSSDYQRVLLGCEGNPWQWLTIAVQAGPDFRNYEENTATHTTPVNGHQPVMYYGEGALTAKFSAHDTVTIKYKQWQWVSSTGKIPCYDSSCDLNYHHQVSAKFSWDLGGKFTSWDYTSGNVATCQRNDTQYSLTAGCGYAVTAHLTATASYAVDLGRNAQGGLATLGVNPQSREYDRQLVSIGAQYKF